MTMRKQILTKTLLVTACSAPVDESRKTEGVFDLALELEEEETAPQAEESHPSDCCEVWDNEGRQIFVMGLPEDVNEMGPPEEAPSGLSLLALDVPALSSEA